MITYYVRLDVCSWQGAIQIHVYLILPYLKATVNASAFVLLSLIQRLFNVWINWLCEWYSNDSICRVFNLAWLSRVRHAFSGELLTFLYSFLNVFLYLCPHWHCECRQHCSEWPWRRVFTVYSRQTRHSTNVYNHSGSAAGHLSQHDPTPLLLLRYYYWRSTRLSTVSDRAFRVDGGVEQSAARRHLNSNADWFSEPLQNHRPRKHGVGGVNWPPTFSSGGRSIPFDPHF